VAGNLLHDQMAAARSVHRLVTLKRPLDQIAGVADPYGTSFDDGDGK
jgi:hypothetical protein